MLLTQLPLSLLLLCQLVLFLDISRGEQCRLQVNNNAALAPGGGNNPSQLPTPNVTASNGAPNPSSTASSTGSSSSTSTTATQIQPFNYGTDIIRGVNLGGWFVLEPWITPSIFENTGNIDIVDEYTFGQMQDNETASSVLQNHWNTWITEADFIDMEAAGLNHVRIPLGYWSVPITVNDTNSTTSVVPYTPGAWPYLLRALNWAKAHNIHVILDIHGAPGSQNGYDNSGQRIYPPQWGYNPANISRTLDIVTYITSNIGGMIDVMELLNEPAGFLGDPYSAAVRTYWQNGYTAVRNAAGGDIKVMIGDAFLGVDSWTDFLVYPQAQGVMMDYHEYQIFSNQELARTFDEHISFACTNIPTLSGFASSNIWTIVGEWSNAPTDCAKWLNGRGVGARWDGSYASGQQVFGSCANLTGSADNFSSSYKTFLRKYWEVQVEIGESIQGWIFWTWKAENADEWSYQKGLQEGWIPQDPTDRIYPNICS